MRCEASVVGLMVKRLACVVAMVVASEASAQGLMTVKVWGSNYNGQMNTPPDLTGVTQVACGGAHTYERAIGLANASVGWAPSGGAWSIYANARNLANTRYIELVAPGTSDVIPAPGRTVQVGANLRF